MSSSSSSSSSASISGLQQHEEDEGEMVYLEEVQNLRDAMKGLGTNEDEVTKITAKCSNYQRSVLIATYKQAFGRDLVEDLKSETSGDFRDLLVALYEDPVEFEARCLHEAMVGLGTDEETLYEILATKHCYQLYPLKEKYNELYGKTLEEDLVGELSGDLKKFLVAIVNNFREIPDDEYDRELAKKEAQELYEAGELAWGTDESVFLRILCTRNNKQLRKTFKEYAKISEKEIREAIGDEFSGDIRDALLCYCTQIIEDPHTYHAKLLNGCITNFIPNHKKIIRIIASRAEIDLWKIQRVYPLLCETSLIDDVSNMFSGDYKKLLVALLMKYSN